jgi:diacylglycerol kinase (ATP)
MNRLIQIIVTPGSGEGRALAIACRLQRALEARGDGAAVRTYTNLAALVSWAKRCEVDFTHLVCVGGDATQSATAAAAVRLSIPFVPVPTGFGNLFARTFGHPDRVDAVLDLLQSGEVRHVDAGVRNDDEIFLSHRSYGVLQDIQESVEKDRGQPRSRLARQLAYLAMAKRFLVDGRPCSLRVDVDGQMVADDANLVTVANVETYRGFLSLTPTASPIDGLFDVFIIPRTSKLRFSARLVQFMLKTPGRWKGTRFCRGRRVAVTIDGRRREELRTLRRALPLLVPPGSVEDLARRTPDTDAPVGSAA